MHIDDEILARIRAIQASDKTAKLEDFQLRVAANGSVLVNLKTRRAYLIYDDDSELETLRDWEETVSRSGILSRSAALKPALMTERPAVTCPVCTATRS